jgi:hypothetical protein
MAHPCVRDGGDALQILSAAENSRGQPTRGRPPASEFGEGLRTLHRKKQHFTNYYSGPRTI